MPKDENDFMIPSNENKSNFESLEYKIEFNCLINVVKLMSIWNISKAKVFIDLVIKETI